MGPNFASFSMSFWLVYRSINYTSHVFAKMQYKHFLMQPEHQLQLVSHKLIVEYQSLLNLFLHPPMAIAVAVGEWHNNCICHHSPHPKLLFLHWLMAKPSLYCPTKTKHNHTDTETRKVKNNIHNQLQANE